MGHLFTIAILYLFQIYCYVQLDRRKYPRWKFLVLLGLVLLDLFVLPRFFMGEPSAGAPRCGMMDLGVVLAFWILGAGGAVIIHLLYFIQRKFKAGQNKKRQGSTG